MNLGWGDPIESPITLVYRRKGETYEHSFHGPVAIIGEDRKKLTWLKRKELPLKDGRLDMTNVPVVGIGGKRKHQPGRAQSFLEENPSFQGALILYPGTGNWDLGEGMLFVTSREVLEGKRFSGGRPETQLTNFRFLRDGRYVADLAKMIHGKILETMETEIEQDVPMETLVSALGSWNFSYFSHPLQQQCLGVWKELYDIEKRRALDQGGAERNIGEFITQYLTRNFIALGLKRVVDLPADFVITAELVIPDLVALRDSFGKIQILGIGWKLIVGLNYQERDIHFVKIRAAVEISPEELKQISDWPFTDIAIRVSGIENMNWRYSDALFQEGEDRWQKILDGVCARWIEIQRSANYPAEIAVKNPREIDPPATPEPVVWGHGLIDGQTYTAYAALHHSVTFGKGRSYDSGWSIRWFDDPVKAEECDAAAREEVYTFTYTRNLLARFAAEAQFVELPVNVPLWRQPKDEADEEKYREEVRTFAKSFISQPAFSCLSFKTREKVLDLKEINFGTPDLSKLRADLAVEWPLAVHLHVLQSQGEILLNWGGHFRVMGNSDHSQYWVIGADGIFRSFTDVDYRKAYSSEGNKHWRIVGPEELALTWGGGISVSVAHRPAEITEEQRRAVAELEARQNFPSGLFGFDDEIKRRNAERLEAIHKVVRGRIGRIPHKGDYRDADPYEFVDYEKGVNIGEPDDDIMRRVNQTAEPMHRFDRREAYLADQALAAGGVVDFYVYHKYGHWNLGIKWRELGVDIISSPAMISAGRAIEETPAVRFADIGDRYFKCGCGATNRVTKSEWKQYQSGSSIGIECSTCGVAGLVARR